MNFELVTDRPLGSTPGIEPGICSNEYTPHMYFKYFLREGGWGRKKKREGRDLYELALNQKTHAVVRLCLKHYACYR